MGTETSNSRSLRFGLLALFLCLHATAGFSQITTRYFETVVMPGSQLPAFVGAPISAEDTDLFLYAYNQENKSWKQISFQFDERDANGDYFGSDGTFALSGIQAFGLDDNDEFLFLARDAGDRNTSTWIDDLDSQKYVRYEIKVEDPISGQMAYAYLYRSSTLALDPSIGDYVKYVGPTNSNKGQDQIISAYYELAHGSNGLLTDLKITTAGGGNGVDIVDRLKIRANASQSIVSLTITENNLQFQSQDAVFVRDGLIRVIRKTDATLHINLPFPFSDINANFVSPPGFYYPYSSLVEVEVPSVSSATVKSGRFSMDLNESASGMKLVTPKNPEPGFAIDGAADDIQRSLEGLLPDGNWLYMNGSQGTLVNFFHVALNVGTGQEMYYKDNSSNDGDDTGDHQSYGDAGVSIAGDIATPFKVAYRSFYLNSRETSAIGSQIVLNDLNPLQINAVPQDYASVPVELVAFNANVEQNDVLLTWRTATESDNFGFEIQSKKVDENDWFKIGFVPGHGTTTQPVSYSFRDSGLRAGTYLYRLKQIDLDGASDYSESISVTIGVPTAFALKQNYPNPFNPSTTIEFEIAEGENAGHLVRLRIYDLLGREIRTLFDEPAVPGFYSVVWNGTDANGLRVASGVYIYRLQAGSFVTTRKMVFVQ